MLPPQTGSGMTWLAGACTVALVLILTALAVFIP